MKQHIESVADHWLHHLGQPKRYLVETPFNWITTPRKTNTSEKRRLHNSQDKDDDYKTGIFDFRS
jgi:ribonucleotide reductase beta subunit family protein with ferritin-like domain